MMQRYCHDVDELRKGAVPRRLVWSCQGTFTTTSTSNSLHVNLSFHQTLISLRPYQLSIIHICAPNIPSEVFSAMCAVACPLNAIIRIRQSAFLGKFALLTQGIIDAARWPMLHDFKPARNVRSVLFILVTASGKHSVQPLQHLATDFPP